MKTLLFLLILLPACTSVQRYEVSVSPTYKAVVVIGASGYPWSRFMTSDRFLVGPDGKPVYLKGDSTTNKTNPLPSLPAPLAIP
jgi:hypothetical protein